MALAQMKATPKERDAVRDTQVLMDAAINKYVEENRAANTRLAFKNESLEQECSLLRVQKGEQDRITKENLDFMLENHDLRVSKSELESELAEQKVETERVREQLERRSEKCERLKMKQEVMESQRKVDESEQMLKDVREKYHMNQWNKSLAADLAKAQAYYLAIAAEHRELKDERVKLCKDHADAIAAQDQLQVANGELKEKLCLLQGKFESTPEDCGLTAWYRLRRLLDGILGVLLFVSFLLCYGKMLEKMEGR